MAKKITPEFKGSLIPGMLLRVHDSARKSGFYKLNEIIVVRYISTSERESHRDKRFLAIMSQNSHKTRTIYSLEHESAKWIYSLEVLEEDDLSATDLLLLMSESTPQFREALQNNGRLSTDE